MRRGPKTISGTLPCLEEEEEDPALETEVAHIRQGGSSPPGNGSAAGAG